jgi:ABC-2 type transport system ATP-binding protein
VPHAAAALLQLHGVTRRFGSLAAVDDVSLDIQRGELLGLLGANGAGKSTLLAMAAGLAVPDAGSVSLDGDRLDPARPQARRRLGLAPQELALYPDLTARENLHFFGRLYGFSGARLARQVADGLAAVQLHDRADNRVGTFSGGMKRRLNLAAAVVHQPEILFLDEPTAGVDPQSRNHIFEEVRRLNVGGMTIVYTSHYMEEVASLCRRIAIMDAGRLVRVGPLSELLADEATVIRFSSDAAGPALRSGALALPAVSAVSMAAGRWEVQTADVASTLPPLIELLRTVGGVPADLEVRQPTLESVFLKLTGHALRD